MDRALTNVVSIDLFTTAADLVRVRFLCEDLWSALPFPSRGCTLGRLDVFSKGNATM